MLWWVVSPMATSREAVSVSSCMSVITVSAGVLLPTFGIFTFESIIGIIIMGWWVCGPAVVFPLRLTK